MAQRVDRGDALCVGLADASSCLGHQGRARHCAEFTRGVEVRQCRDGVVEPIQALADSWAGTVPEASSLLVMALYAAVAGGIAVWQFRWD